MRVGVIGGRSFVDYCLLEDTLQQLEISLLVSGGANGADALAEKYATKHFIETLIFKPDWSIGKSAAALRNLKIVENSDIIVAFWDGKSKGTKMTIDMAGHKGIPVICKIYT